MKNFTAGFIKENPVFALYLGICSALAISNNLNSALGMGVAVTAVLICSNVIISAVRKIVPDEIRIPVYIVIIATLVTIVEMLMHAYTPELHSALGAFINLIVVNCIILGRAEAFASKNSIGASALDGLGKGLGYTFALLLMAIIRQFLWSGGLSLSNPFTNATIFSFTLIPETYCISMFQESTGAFLTFAVLAAIFAVINNKAKAKEAGKGAK